jgi:spore maturation protein SpmB
MAVRYQRRSDGTTGTLPQDVIVNFNYDIAGNAVDQNIFIADTHYEVVKVLFVPTIAGTDASAVSADVKKVTGTDTPASGTTVLASTLDLKGTINTVVDRALTTTVANRKITTGNRIAVDFTGTLTAAVGLIQVHLKRLQTAGADR